LREFEQKGNLLFEEYTRLYYSGGLGNFYLREDELGLECGYFAKKGTTRWHVECKGEEGVTGCMDTFNIIEMRIDLNSNTTRAETAKKAIYKLSTTILLDFTVVEPQQGEMRFSGSLKKSKEETHRLADEKFIDEFHLANIGRMVEDMESSLLQQVQSVQLGKLRSVVQGCRYENTRAVENFRLGVASEINKLRLSFPQPDEKEYLSQR